MNTTNVRIAIVVDWLVVYAGAERVLEQLLDCFPQADIFSLVDFVPDESRGFLHGKRATTSFVQNLPFAKRKYRSYLPLMPLAIEQLDVSGYDIVISSSHAVAKGVLTGPDQHHICYCHSPIRYAWDLQHQYLQESNLAHGLRGLIAKWILHKIRLWDTRTANGVDEFIANSSFIARRIWKTYRRQSSVIYPPVDLERFFLHEDKDDYFLTASRMVPYKKMGLIVQAFNKMPNKKLVVIGDGPEFDKVKSISRENIEILGFQPFETLLNHMQRAKAFVFAAEEDFGITPVEAQACGTPVIAYGRGGSLETVLPDKTGFFFNEQTIDSIVEAVESFETQSSTFDPNVIRANAERFSASRFRSEIVEFVDKACEHRNETEA